MKAEANGRGSRLLDAAGSLCLLLLMLVVLVDVVGRSVLNKPLPWGTELLEVVLAAMIFLLYPVLAIGSGHITVDLINFRPSVQRAQRVLAAILGAVVFGVIGWCVARQAGRSAGYGDASALLGIPTAWVLGGMAVLSAVTVLAFLVAAMHCLRGAQPAAHAPLE
jgi:TRAP-type C4-dicarboxylate transport system permease small subunit